MHACSSTLFAQHATFEDMTDFLLRVACMLPPPLHCCGQLPVLLCVTWLWGVRVCNAVESNTRGSCNLCENHLFFFWKSYLVLLGVV
jgi:hypothetical protein